MCEFLARESVNSSPIVRIFGMGKCKLIANFSVTMMTSIPSLSLSLSLSLSVSLSLSLSLSLSHRAHLTHNIGSSSYNSDAAAGFASSCLFFQQTSLKIKMMNACFV